ncbi:hypothetical protein ACU8KH_06072 [Lachancea thermotolerans]
MSEIIVSPEAQGRRWKPHITIDEILSYNLAIHLYEHLSLTYFFFFSFSSQYHQLS